MDQTPPRGQNAQLQSALRLVGLLLACFLPCSVVAQPPAEPLTLRVLTYNIHHAEGTDGKLDLARIARVINEAKPDLVALQEVDRLAARSAKVDQPRELARLTGMHAVFGGNIPLEGGEYGNVVLSRYRIARHKNHKLPRFGDAEQRGVLEVEIELPDDRLPLLFLATHLDHRRNDRERLASARAIRELVRTAGDRPALLAGDLNDVPDSPTLLEFEPDWKRCNEPVLPTIPAANPTRQIDYVLLRPAVCWRTRHAKVLDAADASDHRAFLAVLELKENGAGESGDERRK